MPRIFHEGVDKFSSMNSTRAHDSNRGVSSPGLEGATAGRELSPVSEEASKRPKLGSSSLGASSGIPDNARGHPSATTTASIRDMGSSMHRINRGLPSNVRLTGTSQLWNRDVDVSDWEVGELSGGQRDVWRPQDFGGDENKDGACLPHSRDPERLRQIQERLLQEESDEEEGDICRICQTGAVSEENPLLTPCGCSGSLHFVHQACMMRWLEAKIKAGADPHTVLICELCKQRLTIDMPDFDIYRLYQQHSSTQVQDNFVSSGLYLVLLLHLCEQRFADVASTPQQRPRSGRLFRLAQFLQRQRQDEPESSDDEIEDLPSYHATVQDGTILITQSRRRREL
uniref:E3 ubiquitin-protein ligase MARCHF7 isoform X5 n=1 Tax=Myxine glutinosa TaxID=7769 RepID=UPI00358F793C